MFYCELKWNLPTATRACTSASNRVHEWDWRKEKEYWRGRKLLGPLHASIPHAAVTPGFTFNGGFIYLRRRPGESFFFEEVYLECGNLTWSFSLFGD